MENLSSCFDFGNFRTGDFVGYEADFTVSSRSRGDLEQTVSENTLDNQENDGER